MGELLSQLPSILIGLLILLLGLYSGLRMYNSLKEYFDVYFKMQKNADNTNKLEEYAVRMNNVTRNLVPWGMTYILSVVLFIIILYSILN